MKREKENVEKDDSTKSVPWGSGWGAHKTSPTEGVVLVRSWLSDCCDNEVHEVNASWRCLSSVPWTTVQAPPSSASQQEDQLTGMKATVTGRTEGDSEADAITWISGIWIHDHLLLL